MTAWRIFTVRRLQGDDGYTVTDDLNFKTATSWENAITDLEKSQQELLTAVKSFPEEKLSDRVPHASHQYTFYTLIHGIIHHDLYHTGQIVLIKKNQS
jgi:hypothetical protein